MEDEQRSFRGIWFPAHIWLDDRLNAIEKMVLLEIDSLDGENGCYASNEYLADFCQCSQRKVSDAISKLKELGYVEVASFDGRTRILHACLEENAAEPSKICESPKQNLRQRILDKSTSKSTKKYIPQIAPKKASASQDDGVRSTGSDKQIVDYLNEKTGKHYRLGKNVRKLINARLSEGYTFDDFKTVIDHKTASWKGTEMEQYLRPSTLFAPSHFDDYLNETPTPSKQAKRDNATHSEPKVGSKRYNSTTDVTEVYKGNGVWEIQQPTLFEGERYEDIPYDL